MGIRYYAYAFEADQTADALYRMFEGQVTMHDLGGRSSDQHRRRSDRRHLPHA
jgi:hypothetical protein